MIIAVTLRTVEAQGYSEPRDAISQDWIRYLEGFAVQPVLVPNSLKNPDAFVRELGAAGLLLSNGEDVGSSPERDRTETALLRMARATRLPVFGACRGSQFINHFFGGTLASGLDHVHPEGHPLEISDPSFLPPSLKGPFRVNSYHRQGILQDGLSPELKAFARSGDGVIEGVFHPTLPIFGIQWHPERKSPSQELDRWLFEKFLGTAAMKKRGAPA